MGKANLKPAVDDEFNRLSKFNLIKNFLANKLNYRVVAEGIETQEQLYLKNSLCERGQGYLLCRPLPSDKLNELLFLSSGRI